MRRDNFSWLDVPAEEAALDEWVKDIASSTELRQWFGHDPVKFTEFSQHYHKELQENPDAPAIFVNWRTHDKVTLLYGARDNDNNEAVVLRDYLMSN